MTARLRIVYHNLEYIIRLKINSIRKFSQKQQQANAQMYSIV